MSGVMVIAEVRDGKVKKGSLEAVTAGRRLCDEAGGELGVVLLGEGVEGLAGDFGKYGADRVYLLEDAKLKSYSTEGYTSAIAPLVKDKAPSILLMSNSILARDLAPRVAARLGTGLLADCTELSLEDNALTAVRPVYGGKANVKVKASNAVPQFATLRPNVVGLALTEPPHDAAVEKAAPQVEGIRTQIKETLEEARGKVDLTEAEFIVAGGRGMKNAENFKLLEELAQVLGGTVGASRVVVDSGWRPHSDQVGQTGKVVNPKLYIACGISGSVQHMAGMGTSRTIVAINSDAEAPIFQKADYGIVADLFTVVPLLTEALKKVMGK